MAITKLMTADDLMQLPDDGNRYDLIEGVLHTMSPAGWDHGVIASALHLLISQFVRDHHLGVTLIAETGFLLAREPDTVMAPDTAFIRADRVPPRELQRGFAPVVPDLVMEVRSPSDRQHEIMTKIDVYLSAGVAMVWFVEPDKRQLTVFCPGQAPQIFDRNDVLDGGDVLPGFQLPLQEVFPDD